MGGLKLILEGSPTGRDILKIFGRSSGCVMLMDCFIYPFVGESTEEDFERLTQLPYIDELKDAVSAIEPDLKLTAKVTTRA